MKTKQISIPVPVKYKWLAIQPWGEIVLFIKKPKIINDDSLLSDSTYWYSGDFDTEMSVTGDYLTAEIAETTTKENWKNSLRKI